MERILHRDNLNRAYKKVKSNKGAGGVDGIFEKTEVGMPQGGPLSPLLSNVMLNER